MDNCHLGETAATEQLDRAVRLPGAGTGTACTSVDVDLLLTARSVAGSRYENIFFF